MKIIRHIIQSLNPTELLDDELAPFDVANMKYTHNTSVQYYYMRQSLWTDGSGGIKTICG